jgi:hypothetical protein
MALTVASCGLAGFNVPFNVLDHHDGVVDHDANGQHKPNSVRVIEYPSRKNEGTHNGAGTANSRINMHESL